jgi:hypothetical protein
MIIKYRLKFIHYTENNPKGIIRFESMESNYPEDQTTRLAIKGLKNKYKNISLLEITKLKENGF